VPISAFIHQNGAEMDVSGNNELNREMHTKLYGKSVVLISTVPFFIVNQLSNHINNLKLLGVKVTIVLQMGTN